MAKIKRGAIRAVSSGHFNSKKSKLVRMSEYLVYLLPFSGDADWDAYWLNGIANLMSTARHTKKRKLNEVMRRFQQIVTDMHKNHPDDPIAINEVKEPEHWSKFAELRCNYSYIAHLIEFLQIDKDKLTIFHAQYYFMMTLIMRDAYNELHPEETPYETDK